MMEMHCGCEEAYQADRGDKGDNATKVTRGSDRKDGEGYLAVTRSVRALSRAGMSLAHAARLPREPFLRSTLRRTIAT
jgi:hypothetical protein